MAKIVLKKWKKFYTPMSLIRKALKKASNRDIGK